MRKYLIAVLFSCVLAVASLAQTPAPVTGDPFESGWHVTVAGGYSNMSGQQTNNGVLTSVAVRVAKHWNARLDYFALATPKAAVIVAGPEYNFSLAHVLPHSDFVNVAKLEGFVNVRGGAGRAESSTSPFKLAIAIGTGVNYHVSDMLIIRPIECSYVRSATVPGQFIGNHAEFASSIGLRF